MSKIGRNEPCPCGSGKKYKKCCLNNNKKEEQVILPELTSILHIRCIKDNLFSDENTKYNYQKVFDDFCLEYDFNLININQDIEIFFEKLEKYVEEIIIGLCCKYTSYEMFYWHRRIHPVAQPRFSNNSVFSSYEIIKSAIFNFGTKQDIFTSSRNTKEQYFLPNYLAELNEKTVFTCKIPNQVIDVLSDLYKLESISLYYTYIRNNRRIAIKGGSIILNQYFGFACSLDQDTEELINLYDKRSNSQTLLSPIGTYSREHKEISSNLGLFCLQLNIDKHKQEHLKSIKFKFDDDSTNFFIGAININDYYQITKGLNEVLLYKNGFEIEDFLAIIINISNTIGYYSELLINENDNPDIHRSFHLIQRGYLLMEDNEKTRREYINAFKQTYVDTFPEKGSPKIKNILAAYNFLFFQQGNYSSLEEAILKGFLFSKVTKDKIIIDCTSLTFILTNLLEKFKSIDGKYANTISTHLENIVNDEVINIFGEESVFCRGEILNDRGEKKEIDSSFIYDNFLFIIECKSLSVSDGSILGEEGAINFRIKKMKEFIKEVEKKVDFISRNKDNLNYKIPKSVTHIVSIVVTSFTEYIWEKTDDLFISNELPRIMTIDELKKLKEINTLKKLNDKSFVCVI